ncbi:tetratricopeptide repeat-containing sensor histidine kinase [Sphingobacterium sp. LRF_L2]|uniref:tetratricopeptide repeat-containing sensor histidine kinase n=1 Tax=Sphingobacterium sp. LRF_L2 TaxID=3369421 RepID=UPI003F62958F
MRIFHFIVLYFLVLSTHAYGQTESQLSHYSDSLYKAAKQIGNREDKAVALLDLSFFWSDHDSSKAFHYIAEAENLLKEKRQAVYYQGLIAFYRASVYFDKEPNKAKDLYMEADRLLEDVKTDQIPKAYRYRARLWGSYGALLQREGKAHEYVEILLDKVIPLAQQAKDSTLLGNNYQNVAINLMNLQEYDKANQYYDKALDLLRNKNNASEEKLTLYVNAARNALYDKDYHRSKRMLDAAAFTATVVPNSAYMPNYHTVAGSYHAAMKNFAKAEEHFSEGLAFAKKINNDASIAALLYDQFKAYQQNKRQQEAKNKLLELLPYIEKSASFANKQMVYHDLATTATELNQYKEAIHWYEAYKDVSDSLFADHNRTYILELEQKYQNTEKEKELLQIKSQHQEQSIALQKSRTLTMVAIAVCILLFLIGFGWYYTQKNKKKILAQKELLLKEELKSHQQETKLNLYNAMLQGEERERIRVARDLHDGLGGMLANVKMKLSAVTDALKGNRVDASTISNLQSIIQQHDRSVNELRRISRNLMPDTLLYRGLRDALQDLCKGLTQPAVMIDFHSAALKENYPHPLMIAVYRIVQELLTNALKHSEAAQIWVQCAEEGDVLYLSVEDNGKGFVAGIQGDENSGMGLENIRNRVALLNGFFEIDSNPGKGSSFHIQIPTR